MTIEQKLTAVLKKAIENGWDRVLFTRDMTEITEEVLGKLVHPDLQGIERIIFDHSFLESYFSCALVTSPGCDVKIENWKDKAKLLVLYETLEDRINFLANFL